MAEQVGSAQAQLESNIEDLRRAALAGGDTAALSQAEGQLQRLGGLQRRLENAGPGALAALRAEVAASIAATQVTTNAARTSATTAQNAEAALHAASEAAHREVSSLARDFYDKKIFDPYLRFTSPEDEETYRKDEAKRQHYIEDQLAKGTPQGNLNAANVMVDQMNDAKAHGADASPEFQDRLDAAKSARNELKSAIARSQQANAVEVAQSASADPLDEIAPKLDPTSKQAMAQFKSAGIVVSDTTNPTHGVAVDGRRGEALSRFT